MSGEAEEEMMYEIMEITERLPSSMQSSILHIHRSFLFSKPTFQVNTKLRIN